MTVPSVKKGEIFTKGKQYFIERDANGYIKEITIDDGFIIKRYVIFRDANNNIVKIEYYEKVV